MQEKDFFLRYMAPKTKRICLWINIAISFFFEVTNKKYKHSYKATFIENLPPSPMMVWLFKKGGRMGLEESSNWYHPSNHFKGSCS